MKRSLPALALLLALIALPARALAIEAPEEYRIESASVTLSDTQAGAHPDFTTNFRLSETEEGQPYGKTRDVIVELPPGLVGNPDAFPKCTVAQFLKVTGEFECPQESQIGSADFELEKGVSFNNEPIYNMPASADAVARFGFYVEGVSVFLTARLDPRTHTIRASAEGAATIIGLLGSSTTFWGVPADPIHDPERITPEEAGHKNGPPGGRPSSLPMTPFMTNPTSCESGRQVTITARSHELPSASSVKTVPFPQITGCGALEFQPTTTFELTTSQGSTGSGLNFSYELPTQGLEHGNLNFGSEMRRAEVVLPEGVTINPSQAEGLGVCSEADFARETYNSPPNQGCPESSKIGSVAAKSPVLDRTGEGSLYVAKPYENPFGSLLALYLTVKIPDRGVFIGVAGEVSLDPTTGQIRTVFDELPQLPVTSFELHFREGARSPLVTPFACGTYQAVSNLSPWSGRPTVARVNAVTVESGPDRGPCPSAGLPPFKPALLAGARNAIAGTFSPFDVRISRNDAEQEITHFSLKLPPGLTAKLAGVPFCSDLAIAVAAGRNGIHGGEEEIASPSCPVASQVGTSVVGVGVGDVLTYLPGKLYLGGPYNGSPISIVSITAAKAGPFDLGTVVVREALRVNPETAEVFVDATGSDPIPHIVRGVPVHLRELRVNVDRPGFALNPTDCTPTSVASTVTGAGRDFASAGDDRPLTISNRFQAADCGALGFKPRLRLTLKGSTKRAGNPSLRAELRAKPGEANIAEAQVTLPHSEFLDNSHIGTVCTRPQFNAGDAPGAGCPRASVYGHARAFTPLLDEPLEGPVFLRSNGGDRNLPDLVAALNGQRIDIALVGYIDSDNGRIRTSFENVPDAPVSRFVLSMAGGKKGLLVNSANLCRGKSHALAAFGGQNGKHSVSRPVLRTKCSSGKGRK